MFHSLLGEKGKSGCPYLNKPKKKEIRIGTIGRNIGLAHRSLYTQDLFLVPRFLCVIQTHPSQPLDRSSMQKETSVCVYGRSPSMHKRIQYKSAHGSLPNAPRRTVVLPQLLGMESLSEYSVLCKINVEHS